MESGLSMKNLLIALGCVLVFPLLTIGVEAAPPDKDAAAARAFVQGFYNWYVPKALNPGNDPVWESMFKARKPVLSGDLMRALSEDDKAARGSPDEVVGLDFDPFLNSQDPGQRYVAGNVVAKNGDYFVEVRAVQSGKMSKTPDVIAELVKSKGDWMFVNFQYPGNGDLLSTLKSLAAERRHGNHP
jgi:hypothetical protein